MSVTRKIAGSGLARALEAAGIIGDPATIKRVVIDIGQADAVTVHVQYFGDERLLDVLPAALAAGEMAKTLTSANCDKAIAVARKAYIAIFNGADTTDEMCDKARNAYYEAISAARMITPMVEGAAGE